MFRFENPMYLYAMIIPVIWLLLHYYWQLQREKRKKRWNPLVFEKDIDTQNFRWKHFKPAIPFVTGIFFIVLALANPQKGSKEEKVSVERADIYIALDISNSMNVRDVAPSRLEKAKKWVTDFILSQKGNRIGLIFYAGNAYLQMPLTFDYASALMYIRSVNTTMAPTQGSSVSEAIALMRNLHIDEPDAQKALIIITDGEDHEGEAIREIKKAVENGTVVFTIGVGTTEGDVIPIILDDGEDLAMEEDGRPAVSRLDADKLGSIARAGNGESYILQSDDQIIQKINARMLGMRKQMSETRTFSEYNNYFIVCILLAMTAFFWEYKNLFNVRKIAGFFFLLILFFQNIQAQSAHSFLKNGNFLYQKEKYAEAENQYAEAAKKDPAFRSHYNRGNALFQQNKYKEAVEAYKKAIGKAEDDRALAHAHHNLGNSHFHLQQYKESVEAYKKALQFNPNDKETIENLLKARKLLQKQKQQEEDKKKQNQEKEQKQSPEEQQKNQENKPDSSQNNQKNPENQETEKKDKTKSLSREEAEKLMEIIENEDNKVNQKIRRGGNEKKKPSKPW